MRWLWMICCGFFSFLALGQQQSIPPEAYIVYGKITDQQQRPLPKVKVYIFGETLSALTDDQGNFTLNLPKDATTIDLVFSKEGYRTQTLPFVVSQGQDLILQNWVMFREINLEEELPTIDLQDLQSIGNDFDRAQIGSVLHAQRDPFLNAAAFQFSSSFFRLRGLDSRHNTVTFNGIPMNAFDNGRPLWSQWGGLNDFTNRTQQFQFGIRATEDHFGGLLGLTRIELRPSALFKGSKISQAFSNATYQYRSMISRVGDIGENSQYALLFSYRGGSGYREGTPYQALSGLFSFEKNWSAKHHSWITALFTPNSRGKSAPLTQEVFDLKGIRYNPHWGLQNGKIRNARVVEVALPMLLLNHQWQMNRGWSLRFNWAYHWGKYASGRINYNGHQPHGNFLSGGGQNPDPTYYQKLPSYFLKSEDQQNFQAAYLAQKQLLEAGQIDWKSLYDAHQNKEENSSIYSLYQDVKAPQRVTASLQGSKYWDNGFKWNFNGIYSTETTAYFAKPQDLLGATHLWDFNPFASDFEKAQNDLNQPNRKLGVGEVFLYHYDLSTQSLSLATQLEYQDKGIGGFVALKIQSTNHQRIGKFKNGNYPNHSMGVGEPHHFLGANIKGGIHYAITGRTRFFFDGGFFQLPPPQQNLYVNPRENHWVIPNAQLEKHWVWDVGYQYQTNLLDIKLSAFWIQQKDLTEVSFYFADGVGGDRALFVQELLSGLQKDKKGLEFYGVFHPVPELKITAVAAIGEFLIDNNPELFLSSVIDETSTALGFESGFKNMGQSQLKGYAEAGGPHRALSIGLDYEDPNYWRMGFYGNYFSHSFLDSNPLLRTPNFLMDNDGLPFSDYDPEKVKSLLQQERFPNYFLLNATGGKSWRLGSNYFGFFVSIQNLLNTTYKTGGFQQGRNANYRSLLEDQSRELPLFGPKYWWGRGTTYFASIYFRF